MTVRVKQLKLLLISVDTPNHLCKAINIHHKWAALVHVQQ